jgi:hypothetical protein
VAISTLAKSSISTFDKFNRTSGGNVSGSAVFAFADGTSTYRTSPDGLTWTSFTTPGSTTGLFLTYHSAANGWQWWNGGLSPIFYNKNLYLSRFYTFSSSNSVSGNVSPYNSGSIQSYFGSKTYFGANANTTIADENYAIPMRFTSAPFASSITRPAWDGVSTWAIITSQKSDPQYARFSTQGVAGSALMPAELEGVGQVGYSAWTGYTPPTGGQFVDIIFWQGFWFVINNAGTVYRTANIATASPTWTTMTTLSNVFGPFFIANNELWVLTGGATGNAAHRLTSPTGSWSSITLPSTKNSHNIVFGNGVYLIFNSDGTVFRSTTGNSGSWSSISTGSTNVGLYRLTGGFGPSNA